MPGFLTKNVLTMKYLAALVFALSAVPAAVFAAPPPGYSSLDQLDAASSMRASGPGGAAVKTFEARRGESLRITLARWANAAGWQEPVWQLPEDTDFTLGATGAFEGDFLSSTKALINALGHEANLRVRFHHANRVLVVEPLQ